LSIDKKSPIPAYYQLMSEIKNKISSGIWPVGHCIDSERTLAEDNNVSRMTVRQAIGELVQEGLLTREKGKGTFVCEPKLKQKNIMSFSEIMKNSDADFKTKVTVFEKIAIEEEFSIDFESKELYKIERLRIVNNIIVAIERIYIPCDFVPTANKENLEASFYELLKESHLSVENSEASVVAVLSDHSYKTLFTVTEDIPLLKMQSKNYDSEDNLIFIEESIYRSDKYVLEIDIYKRKGKVR